MFLVVVDDDDNDEAKNEADEDDDAGIADDEDDESAPAVDRTVGWEQKGHTIHPDSRGFLHSCCAHMIGSELEDRVWTR